MINDNRKGPWKEKKIFHGYESGLAPKKDSSYTPVSTGGKQNTAQVSPAPSASAGTSYTDQQNTQQVQQNPSTAPSAGAGMSYTDQLNSLYNQIMNRGKFQYDLNGDMLYRQMADQYTQLGRQAMMDTMGQAAALTGGYGNSYATTAGNQAYQQYLTALNNSIPDLYSQALAAWQAQGDELLNKYQLTAQHQATLDAMKPKTGYTTNTAKTTAEGTQAAAKPVDPSYWAAIKALIASNYPFAADSIKGVENPLTGFYEKNYESMQTDGKNKDKKK